MKSFINVEDIGDLRKALAEAQEIKLDRYKYQHLGRNKTLMMIFFNNSLRTRLSTQKAAMNLGMNVIVLFHPSHLLGRFNDDQTVFLGTRYQRNLLAP